MSDKKHIDRLFQESFKDFEATPSDAVWGNIEAELNQKKKKRRVIPIWWRYAGIAALLLLLLTVGVNFFINNDETQKNQIVDTENNSIKSSEDKNEVFEELNKNKEVITNNNSQNSLNKFDGTIANTEEAEASLNKNILKDKVVNPQETLVTETSNSQNRNESRTNRNLPSNNKLINTNSALKTKTAIASNVKEEENNTIEKIQAENDGALIDKNKASEILNNSSKNNTGVAQNNAYKEELKDKITPENNKENNGLTLEEAINKDKDIIEKEKLNRWSIAPNAAPVYFNTLGEGSSIDPQFNSNSKTGDLNMSYGISASYAVNKKLSIRSGINRVNLGYNTNNVVVFQSIGLSSSSSALQNVSVGSNGSSSDAFSNGNSENISVISGENLASDRVPNSLATSTSINQDLGYIEVPLEIQYALSNRKFGVNIIGGFSSFFLSDNKIFSEAGGGQRIFLGEATNINKISYSANFGLGLNYQMSKKIDFNLEPMFKYQINTFNNTSGDFQPFFIGVYTGFAIKF